MGRGNVASDIVDNKALGDRATFAAALTASKSASTPCSRASLACCPNITLLKVKFKQYSRRITKSNVFALRDQAKQLA